MPERYASAVGEAAFQGFGEHDWDVRALPTGTVTFLFTDIEGSTRLLHELGDAYAEALADHRRLLRASAFRCSAANPDAA